MNMSMSRKAGSGSAGKYILGIDVGGTKIAAGLVNSKLQLSRLQINPTSQIDLIGQLQRLIESYDNFDAIALALPGQVLADGTVTHLPNVRNFELTNFKKVLQKKFKVPISVINDAKAFALAEATLGHGKKSKVVAGAILGTGVGVGIVINKQIYFGKDSVAGEFEHITLLDGKTFRDYRHAAGTFKYATDAKIYLKTLLEMIILSFNPDMIVLGGAWSKLPDMEQLANKLAINVGDYANQTPVKISRLEYPGILGAAITILKK